MGDRDGVARRASAALAVLAAALVWIGQANAATTGLSAWGDNSGGELGNGTLTQSDVPVAVGGVSDVKAVAAGYRFNLALLSDGTVDTWGENQSGELGNGTLTTSTVAKPVSGLTGVSAVAAGGAHALALLSNGTVVAWGYNAFGQLGNGSSKDSLKPVAVPGLSGVTAIAAGEEDSLALLSNGTVMAWGDNRDGELGNGTFTQSDAPVQVTGLTGVQAIAAGGFFNAALLSNGTVMTWGQGLLGELGNGQDGASDTPVAVTGLSNVSAISSGHDFTLALLKTGTVAAWGDDAFDQLGDPSVTSSSNVPVPVSGLSGVSAVAGGGLSGLALLSGGTVDAWGSNALGELGNGTTNDATVPTPVTGLSGVTAISDGAEHGIAITGTGSTTTPPGIESPWRGLPTPNPGAPPPPQIFNSSIVGVSAASPTEAWAVGDTSNGASQTPFGLHWNGTVWQPVSMPSPSGRTVTLGGVFDVSASDAWAVGYSVGNTSSTDQDRTLIEHWDGTAWSIVPSPNPITGSGGQDQLSAVAGVSGDDIWAAGDDFDSSIGGSDISLLFEHFNGTSWTAAPSPPSNGFDFASGLTMISSDDAWAVGTNGFTSTLAAHWNGTAWSIVPTPSPQDGSNPTNQLTGVSAVGTDDVWASGYEANVDGANFRKPYLLHWNGTGWTLVNAANAGTEGSMLRGVAAVSTNDIWAVGQVQEDDGSILTLSEHFNGSGWRSIPTPDPGGVESLISNTLGAVTSAGDGTLFAVGSREQLGLCCSRTFAVKLANG